MEKFGVIAPGITPPEHEQDKTASELEDSPVTRLVDAVVSGHEACEEKQADASNG